ncbi:hypothetical protein F6Y04_00075 [Bacillus megaterium]|nr:hypothetical protein [Priestia megaterium]
MCIKSSSKKRANPASSSTNKIRPFIGRSSSPASIFFRSDLIQFYYKKNEPAAATNLRNETGGCFQPPRFGWILKQPPVFTYLSLSWAVYTLNRLHGYSRYSGGQQTNRQWLERFQTLDEKAIQQFRKTTLQANESSMALPPPLSTVECHYIRQMKST